MKNQTIGWNHGDVSFYDEGGKGVGEMATKNERPVLSRSAGGGVVYG